MTIRIEGYKIEQLGSGRLRALVCFVEYRRLHRRRWREVLGEESTLSEAKLLVADHIRNSNPGIVVNETSYGPDGKIRSPV